MALDVLHLPSNHVTITSTTTSNLTSDPSDLPLRSASMGETLSEEGGAEGGRRGGRSAYPVPPAASMVLSPQRRGASLGRKSLSMGLRGDSQVRGRGRGMR